MDGCLKSIVLNPDKKYRELFLIQDMVALSAALWQSQQIRVGSLKSDRARTEINSTEIALKQCMSAILSRISLALGEWGDFEKKIKPPRKYWMDFIAATVHGPPKLDRYYYIYGLIDCATQICRMTGASVMACFANFSQRMKRVVVHGTEPTFRWKAVSSARRHCNDRLNVRSSNTS